MSENKSHGRIWNNLALSSVKVPHSQAQVSTSSVLYSNSGLTPHPYRLYIIIPLKVILSFNLIKLR